MSRCDLCRYDLKSTVLQRENMQFLKLKYYTNPFKRIIETTRRMSTVNLSNLDKGKSTVTLLEEVHRPLDGNYPR